jgi:hypothetical protein
VGKAWLECRHSAGWQRETASCPGVSSAEVWCIVSHTMVCRPVYVDLQGRSKCAAVVHVSLPSRKTWCVELVECLVGLGAELGWVVELNFVAFR